MTRPKFLLTRARSILAAGVGLALVVAWAPQLALASPGLVVADLNQPGVTPTVLAQSLVGSGVTISNITYTGNNRAAGKFSGGATILGFDSGVVLASGKVQTYPTDPACSRGVEGPNLCHEGAGLVPPGASGGANSTSFGAGGDADLTALAGFSTFDATILQFDFVPMGATVQFQYVFSSEEYSDYSNTPYNDVFGFFINGTMGSGNCATTPANQPVSVNTINNGNDVGGDITPHNVALFRDNVRPTGPTIDTQMDGLTVVLTCKATVMANQTNHMKLAIADASDSVLDSAVFIEAGSLTSGTVVTTSLKGSDGSSGPIITVPSGTVVTDSAKLTGLNTMTAGGTVDYTVYKDAMCSPTMVFATAGTKTVTNGVVPDSDPVTFTSPATYYWQAAYSGDTFNNPSKSVCETEQVIVNVGPPASLVLTPPGATNTVGTKHCVLATVKDASLTPVPGVTVVFHVGPSVPTTFPNPSDGTGVTDANGQATFCYTASLPGMDTIHAFADTNNNGQQDANEPFGEATKTWTPPASTNLCEVKITDGGWFIANNKDRANFGGNAQVINDTPQGQQEYQDQGPAQPMNVHSIEITATTCSDNLKNASIYGKATIDGAGTHVFKIDVTDMGQGGSNDSYGITLDTGYQSGQHTLSGGNITIHKS